MPGPAFVPAQFVEAEGRSWRSFCPRQVRGLALGAAGGLTGALVWGISTLPGFIFTALLALPGFAYGFCMPASRPVEWWVRVFWRYYTTPRVHSLAARRTPARPQSPRPDGRKERGRRV